jgi:hypothetical protein
MRSSAGGSKRIRRHRPEHPGLTKGSVDSCFESRDADGSRLCSLIEMESPPQSALRHELSVMKPSDRAGR